MNSTPIRDIINNKNFYKMNVNSLSKLKENELKSIKSFEKAELRKLNSESLITARETASSVLTKVKEANLSQEIIDFWQTAEKNVQDVMWETPKFSISYFREKELRVIRRCEDFQKENLRSKTAECLIKYYIIAKVMLKQVSKKQTSERTISAWQKNFDNVISVILEKNVNFSEFKNIFSGKKENEILHELKGKMAA